ncbi:MAG: trypsin-like peptidase domain-containing protein [Myxococcota bacterium]
MSKQNPSTISSGFAVFLLLVFAAIFGAAAGFWGGVYALQHQAATDSFLTGGATRDRSAVRSSSRPTPRPVAPRGDLSELEQNTIEVFRGAYPSVVHITTLAMRQDLFRRNVTAVPRGTGTGFVWDEKGHIVTNYHVVRGGNAARVALADGTVWDARLVGYYDDKDLAVLKIDARAEQLVPLTIGTSADLVVGQRVYAIGNPFGLDHTLSTGVVSAVGREIPSVGGRPIQGAIQTDAAINPGNSGGPLLDSAGRLIGVNTQIYSPSGASAGVGFAVPVDAVRRVVPQLVAQGRVTRPVLGVDVDEGRLAQRIGLEGVMVLGVTPGSGAEQAGLRAAKIDRQSGSLVVGDVIVSVEGESVGHSDDVFRILESRHSGDTVSVQVVRDGEKVTLPITLSGIPDQ